MNTSSSFASSVPGGGAAPLDLVIFGGVGDLSLRKLLPALYQAHQHHHLPAATRIHVLGRQAWDRDAFVAAISARVLAFIEPEHRDPAAWQAFLASLNYLTVDATRADDYRALGQALQPGSQRVHYLATAPSLFTTICAHLHGAGLVDPATRVVLEKPLGHDLASARAINDDVGRHFAESQIYRIDHYLGKETVQNLLALRFANQLFEPLWNSKYVDHVQITMAEDIGIGGRAGYYDGIGAARDVIQNHLLQLMALTAMEEPVSFTAKDLTAEKTKVLSAVRLPKDLAANTARGQYAKGWQGSHEVVGYLEEKGIDPKSTTETYAAIRLDIDTRRWAGVPFYLRCGKRLGKRVTEIAVVFKRAPHLPFEQTAVRELGKNAIVIRVQPDEGVTMRFGAKVPGGSTMEVRDVNMDFSYGRSFTENSPEAYERLILDVLLGDPPLFPTTEEVNLSWEILDPIEQFWSTLGQPQAYRAGTWGPAQADEMLARDGRHWRMP